MFKRREPITRTRRTERCPVCKAMFGGRFFNEIAKFECKECEHEFTFYPFDPTPKAEHLRKKDTKCGCGRCNS